jgi:hypothetical protein
MTKLFGYLKNKQREEIQQKEANGELSKVDDLTKERSLNFRQVLTNDPLFEYHKKMLF